MPEVLKFSQLSRARQALVRILQAVNYGEIRGVRVQDANPLFDPAPVGIIDAKLDTDECPRPELQLVDFDLRDEVLRLMNRLDEFKDGLIERIEVRAGVPRRIVFQSRLPEVMR